MAFKYRKDDKGFSIAELLMALAIMGILAAIVIPTALNQKGQAVVADMKADLLVSSVQVETLLTGWRGVPPSQVSITTTDGTWYATPVGENPVASGKVNAGNTLTGTLWTDGSYCLQDSNSELSKTYIFRSDNQAISEGTCPDSALGGAGSLAGSTSVSLPGSVTGVTATSSADNTVTVSWDPIADASSYTVVLSGLTSREVSSGTSTTFTGVQPGSVTATVYSRNNNGAGPGVSTTVTVGGSLITGSNATSLSNIIGSDELPKGKVAFSSSSSDVTINNSSVRALSDLSSTYVAASGRLYRVSFTLPQVNFTSGSDRLKIAITVNGNTVQTYLAAQLNSGSNQQTVSGSFMFTASGTTTVSLNASRDSGTGTITILGSSSVVQQLLVEDMGLA